MLASLIVSGAVLIACLQLCGPHPDHLTKCAQLLDETISVDFVDVNCGCPIDLVVNRYLMSRSCWLTV